MWTDVDPLLKKHNFGQVLTICKTSLSHYTSLHDIAQNLLLTTLIQQTTKNVTMQP